MNRFCSLFQPFLTYYSVILIGLIILYYVKPSTLVFGLIVGAIGSIINTCIFEYYLWRSLNKTTSHISTGNSWRYLVAIICCVIWLLFRENIHIIGILIGLLISYLFIVFRPIIKQA
ncbi:hypothetical protein DOS70_01690 [Staphylococcus felis]|uniref:ATP synthase subunit I n=2 Tax=Staphylococcus felis TaxID=46127 RepID=A0AAQ0HNU1_9STAP|nr:ATP synthase subunit I [Staphylococcus felis]AVP35482.1 hypothetical protein C7J90_00225 [Staphylococcus felis]MBH9581323.1 ATP synthase subunit I [Staphylococcus felis]PNZ38137.1 hypothetical protein CD143_00785 [Staphylococcus felis]QQB02424.1 ATP synthase subunit I [Staphylococcus felis]REH74723.1 hypothetical protein DOS60_10725 [Staphylococcus felis]